MFKGKFGDTAFEASNVSFTKRGNSVLVIADLPKLNTAFTSPDIGEPALLVVKSGKIVVIKLMATVDRTVLREDGTMIVQFLETETV